MLSHETPIRTAYEAFNRRDIDAVPALMIHGVEWPNGMEGGHVCGHSVVRGFAGKLVFEGGATSPATQAG